MKEKYVVVNWDTYDEELDKKLVVKGLSRVIKIPNDIMKEYQTEKKNNGCPDEIITNYLSDEYGWCVNSWIFKGEVKSLKDCKTKG